MEIFPKRVSATSLCNTPSAQLRPNEVSALHDPNQAPSLSSPASSPCSDALMTALSLVTHSRIYAGQFLSSAPFNSLSARSLMASRSTRRTSLRSMATTLLSCSSNLRKSSTSFPVIRPLMCKIRRPGPITTRSILQVIVGLRSRFYSLRSQARLAKHRRPPVLTYEGRQHLPFPAALAANVIA
jgi:hypothetical protein